LLVASHGTVKGDMAMTARTDAVWPMAKLGSPRRPGETAYRRYIPGHVWANV